MKEIDKIEKYLEALASDLEPKTHCCECTPGDHRQRHLIHIQYPNCNCNPEDYIIEMRGLTMIDWICPICGFKNTQHKDMRVERSKCYNCGRIINRENMIELKYWHL